MTVTLLNENLSLLEENLNLLDKQIIAEETKLQYGESTQYTVDYAYASRDAAQQNYNACLAQIDYEKQMLSYQIEGDVYSISYTIPDELYESNNRYLAQYQEALINNNISMKEHEMTVEGQKLLAESLKNIGGSNDTYYLEAMAEYNSLFAQKDEYKEQLLLYAIKIYNENNKIESEYQASISKKDALMEQRNILSVMYEQGEISELDYLSNNYEISKSLFEIKSALAAKANSLFSLDLLYEGIVLNS